MTPRPSPPPRAAGASWMYRWAARSTPGGTSTKIRVPRGERYVPDRYPYELKLPLAPYRFVWRDEPAVDAQKSATESFTEERYTHADGTTTIIREYGADGSFHILSDRGEIELIDNAQDPYAADPVSVVRLP
jgi:hypothetical protein